MHQKPPDLSGTEISLQICQKQIDDQLDSITRQVRKGKVVPESRKLLFLLYRSFNALERAQQVIERSHIESNYTSAW
ncbi:hypothetical protein [Caballeronia sp. GAWG1-5s-s]|uniref:hypothetical protein n=1 Tax=Caballeronia sp. GAWG1-5s-s TaxID=2921743 RepID=UPI0020296140|nr:hypothetical protein [Caballeronia sp. GAWG1-5s-s]